MENLKKYIVCSVGILKTLVNPGRSLTIEYRIPLGYVSDGRTVPLYSSLSSRLSEDEKILG